MNKKINKHENKIECPYCGCCYRWGKGVDKHVERCRHGMPVRHTGEKHV